MCWVFAEVQWMAGMDLRGINGESIRHTSTLKPTYPLKMDGWKATLSLPVSFRECILHHASMSA